MNFFNRVFLLSYIVTVLLVSTVYAEDHSKFEDHLVKQVEFLPGEQVVLPNRSGNYIFFQWHNTPLFYNPSKQWFQEAPIRNYTTVRFVLPTVEQFDYGYFGSDYVFYEVDSKYLPDISKPVDETNHYPDTLSVFDWANWKAVRTFPLHVKTCISLFAC